MFRLINGMILVVLFFQTSFFFCEEGETVSNVMGVGGATFWQMNSWS